MDTALIEKLMDSSISTTKVTDGARAQIQALEASIEALKAVELGRISEAREAHGEVATEVFAHVTLDDLLDYDTHAFLAQEAAQAGSLGVRDALQALIESTDTYLWYEGVRVYSPYDEEGSAYFSIMVAIPSHPALYKLMATAKLMEKLHAVGIKLNGDYCFRVLEHTLSEYGNSYSIAWDDDYCQWVLRQNRSSEEHFSDDLESVLSYVSEHHWYNN